MKIALMSTCALATPPQKYGGTELFVAELAKALVEAGHEATVFATGDSRLPRGVTLRAIHPVPIWPPDELAELRHARHAWNEVARELPRFDVVHLNHAAQLVCVGLVGVPAVMTLHHHRDSALTRHYADFAADVSFVAISRRQAALCPELDLRRVVHHGLDPERYPEGDGRGGYVAFLGRFAPEKAPHLAVRAARLAGVPIQLGGVYHEVAQPYRGVLEPELLRTPGARCLGELGHAQKLPLLAGASALLFPITWEEPFGLVMIEAMLMGTPVIAFRRGSAAEVVEEGVTGFLVEDELEMAARIADLPRLDRARCRARARARWSAARMARDYAELYAQRARTALFPLALPFAPPLDAPSHTAPRRARAGA
jgi:glycosyltransferase involved in cell wall biosynthesis